MSADNNKTYLSKGQILDRPPLSVRILRFFESIYIFLGLYVVSLFALDPYTAAQNSQFNIIRSGNKPGTGSRWGGGSYGSGGGGGGGGSDGPRGGRGGGPGRRIGQVDDIRGPECGSCR